MACFSLQGRPAAERSVLEELRYTIQRAAVRRSPVLILGPTGAGKELVARGLHFESGRTGRLVAANAAAIPESLFESELMGHVRGAFTGAMRDRPGLVRRARNGTLFLDEIGDLSVSMQVKLLRLIDTREVCSVGADSGECIDFRLVTATNVDLEAAEGRGGFRRDLLYRLRGIVLTVPALRDHPEDIGRLAAYFAMLIATDLKTSAVDITPKALERLEAHSWPGNVRELRQTIEYAAFLTESLVITEVHVERALRGSGAYPAELSHGRDESHRRQLSVLLARYDGDVAAVALALGVTRSTAYRRMHRLGIVVSRRGPRIRVAKDRSEAPCVVAR